MPDELFDPAEPKPEPREPMKLSRAPEEVSLRQEQEAILRVGAPARRAQGFKKLL